MRVWIVEANRWDGEHDSVGAHKVFSSYGAAFRYCEKMNDNRSSGYSTSYAVADDDGFQVEDE